MGRRIGVRRVGVSGMLRYSLGVCIAAIVVHVCVCGDQGPARYRLE
jgi:hypothetical protein